jgi:hypothetical protein
LGNAAAISIAAMTAETCVTLGLIILANEKFGLENA